VDLVTGLFLVNTTDLFLPDVMPIEVTRTYRPGDTSSRPFGIGTTHPYAIFLWSARQYQEVDLILPDGGRVHYVRTSPGVGFADAVFEHTATPSKFYKSTIRWNGNGWDLSLKDGTVFVFGENAPLQAIRDRLGNQITLTRAGGGQGGNITLISSPNGRWIQLTYDTSNRITQATDNIGRVVAYTYDVYGRLATVTDANGGVTQYTYDSSHQMVTLTDPRGIVHVTNVYDGSSRVVRQTQADGTTYQFSYVVDAGKVVQTDVTDPRQVVRRVTFNGDGFCLSDTKASGASEQQTTTYERLVESNLLSAVIGTRNRRTEVTYDAMGNVIATTRLAGTAGAVTTTMTYEPAFNQVTSLTDPLGHTTRFTHDSRGNRTAIIDALGKQTTFDYNAAGQPVSITDPLGNRTTLSYEGGTLVMLTDPGGKTSRRFADATGRVRSVSDELGRVARYEYDGANRLIRATDPLGGTTPYAYDPDGNLTSVTDARNNAITKTYDNMNRLTARQDALLRTETFTYDAGGNLMTFVDRRGTVAVYTYDSLNRRTFAGFGRTVDGSGTPSYESTISDTYDDGGRLIRTEDSADGTITRTYDELDRLTSESSPQGTVGYTYDASGRRATMTVSAQPPVTYTYDDANRLVQVAQGSAIAAMAYDDAGRRTTLTLPNGIVVVYSYDGASRIGNITYNLGPQVLGDLTYSYDAAGNRVGVGGSWARTALPDAVSSATYDAANELTQHETTMLTYDANGNLTTDGLNSYVWDARNQLAGMTGPAVTVSFQYDPLGRRTRKVVNGTPTEFLYDDLNPVEELSQGTVQASLLHGLGLDEHFVRIDAAGTRSFLTDALGSTLALTDTSGVVETAYTYEPFGAATVSGSIAANAFQYTGRENDGTGLYYYRARYYSPTWQRFVSEDRLPSAPFRMMHNDLPVVFVGKNLYVYAENSPLMFTDPLGLYPICPPGSHAKFSSDLLLENIYENRSRFWFLGLSCLVVSPADAPILTPIFCGSFGATVGNCVNQSYVCVQDHP